MIRLQRTTLAVATVIGLWFAPAAAQAPAEGRGVKSVLHRPTPSVHGPGSPPRQAMPPAHAPPVTFARTRGIPSIAGTGANPPDPHAAVGPAGIVQVVNRWIQYRRREGTLVWEKDLQQFFAEPPVDPRVIFDPVSQRFVVAAISNSCTTAALCLAVSHDADPDLDAWFKFTPDITQTIGSQVPNKYGADYTTLGHDHQAVYVSLNTVRLPITSQGPFCPYPQQSGFAHASIYVIDKADLLAGILTMARVNAPPGVFGGFTLQPAAVVGAPPGNVAYFAETPPFETNDVRVWALADPLGARVLTSAVLAVPDNGGSAWCAPQASGPDLDVFPNWTQNAVWKDGSLWFCHTAAGALGQAAPFYYHVATNGFPAAAPVLIESGGIETNGVWNFQPAVGMNAAGDVCMAFTQSTAATYPRIMAVARLAGDASFSAPVVVHTSPTFYADDTGGGLCGEAARWGDYGSVALDPYDDSFWVSHEIAQPPVGTQFSPWATTVSNVVFPHPDSTWDADGVVVRAGYTAVGMPRAAADGAGGAWIAWSDHRTESRPIQLYRVESDGSAAAGWPTGGRDASGIEEPAEENAQFLEVVRGGGRAYLVWERPFYYGGRTLRARRMEASGAIPPEWSGSGVRIDTLVTPQRTSASEDGAGGLLVAWRAGNRVRVNRLSPQGELLWGTIGLDLGDAVGGTSVVAGGGGGAIVFWNDDSLRAQGVDGSGAIRWPWAPAGVAIGGPGIEPRAVPDGAGGAIVAYRRKETTSADHDVHATRVGAGGSIVPGWEGSIPAGAAPGNQAEHQIAPDGAGGALITWTDFATPGGRVFVARLGASGAFPAGWSGGVAVAGAAPGGQARPAIVADGAKGAVVAWEDARGIYAQHVLHSGILHPDFPANGREVTGAETAPSNPRLVAAAPGQAVVAWEEMRNAPAESPNQIRAGRVVYSTAVDVSDPIIPGHASLTLSMPRPNPTSGATQLVLEVPAGAAGQPLVAEAYDIGGRRLMSRPMGLAQAGRHAIEIDLRDVGSNLVPAGVYLVRVRVGGRTLERSVVVLP